MKHYHKHRRARGKKSRLPWREYVQRKAGCPYDASICIENIWEGQWPMIASYMPKTIIVGTGWLKKNLSRTQFVEYVADKLTAGVNPHENNP